MQGTALGTGMGMGLMEFAVEEEGVLLERKREYEVSLAC